MIEIIQGEWVVRKQRSICRTYLEGGVSLEGNGKRLRHEPVHEVDVVVGTDGLDRASNVLEAGGLVLVLLLALSRTRALGSDVVAIDRGLARAVLGDPLVAVREPATLAGAVGGVAVNEVLLGEVGRRHVVLDRDACLDCFHMKKGKREMISDIAID